MIMEYISQSVFGKATVSNHSLSTLDPGPLAWLMITSSEGWVVTLVYPPSMGYVAKQIRYEDFPLQRYALPPLLMV